MLELQRFYLKKYHLWLDAEFVFLPGVSLVTGGNRTGKTLLFRGVKQALRAQAEKRGSSLSKLPKGSTIGLDFKTGETQWGTKLTPTVLSLMKDGKDQGSTGKNAARTELAKAMPIHSDLFDSTIHVSGAGSHPLIQGTSATRLAWVSAVLDLTDAYDVAAARIDKDLKHATTAATQLDILRQELAEIKLPGKLPNVKGLRRELGELREVSDRYSRTERLLDALDQVRTKHAAADYEDLITEASARIKQYRKELKAAEAYEAEHSRAQLVESLRDKLTNLGQPSARASTLTAFCDALESLNDALRELRTRWTDSESDRRILAKLQRIMEEAPDNLDHVIAETKAKGMAARERYRNLRHVAGSECPTCRAKLTEQRRQELMDEAGKLWNAAEDKLMKFERFIEARENVRKIEPRIKDVRKPPTLANLDPLFDRFSKDLRVAQQVEGIKGRLKDLNVSGTDLPRPKLSADVLGRMLDEEEQKLISLRVKYEHAIKADEIEAKLVKLHGKDYDEAKLRKRARQYAQDIEDVVAEIAQAEQLLAEVERLETRRERLEDQIHQLAIDAKHLPELLELKEAMGRKGLRLTKIKELAVAFAAEFNNLIPMFWDDFTIEVEVKESGLDIFATRHESRSDLASLSSSEEKVWKLITALVLVRLLPDKLRCNTIILDELEANMHPETRRRFVAEYLPELGKSIDNIVLVSPLDYQDLPLVTTASYMVENKGAVSHLRRTK